MIHHVLPGGYAGVAAKLFKKVPFLLFSHGTDLIAGTHARWKRAMVARIARRAEQVIFNSESLKRRFLRVLPQFEKKSMVLYPCPETAFLISSMMKDVINYGTGWRIKALGRPVAGKTGTTNEYRDAWFVGYTPDVVTGVWTGFDDMRPLGDQETGARAASPIWLNFMRSIDLGEPLDFTVPENIASFHIDPANGLLARTEQFGIKEYFKSGTQPIEYSPTQAPREIKEPQKLDLD